MQINRRALLVVNGDNDVHYLRQSYRDYDYIAAADGASVILQEAGITPQLLIGDFDSTPKEVVAYFAERGTQLQKLNPEKDLSDTEAVLNRLIEAGYKQIDIMGAMGGRWDHMIANVNLLYYGYQRGIALSLVDARNYATIIGIGARSIKAMPNSYCSFFALFEEAIVTLEHFKYPLQSTVLTQGISRGLSNEFTERDATLRVEKGCVLMVLSQKDR